VATTPPFAKKPFASSILLWMRADQPRQQGMDHWKGPHSKIISATPGMEEYRQIPSERKIDGVAEITFTSLLSPLRGRKQTKLAYKDEVNVFRRTLLYAGPPYSARWYDVAGPGERAGARSLIYLRKREGVKTGAFRTFLADELVPAFVRSGALRQLRTQVFLPWIERLWDTPNVAHDNPTDQRFHASLILGFSDANALWGFFGSGEIAMLSGKLPEFVSAVHAYEVTEALTYVKDGEVLAHYEA
jgi:hypothetical protein